MHKINDMRINIEAAIEEMAEWINNNKEQADEFWAIKRKEVLDRLNEAWNLINSL